MTHSIRGDKSICLPLSGEDEYKAIPAFLTNFAIAIAESLMKSGVEPA